MFASSGEMFGVTGLGFSCVAVCSVVCSCFFVFSAFVAMIIYRFYEMVKLSF